tara:strand:- start:1020 stop:1271 length:252 start_codon:yes stop_codon:yes gene_type:complete
MSEALEITELKQWLANPTTKKFSNILKNDRKQILENVSQNYSDNNIVRAALGKCEGIEFVINILEAVKKDEAELKEFLELYYE